MRREELRQLIESNGQHFVEYDAESHYVIYCDTDGFYKIQKTYHYGRYASSPVSKKLNDDLLQCNLKLMCEKMDFEYCGFHRKGTQVWIRYRCTKCSHENDIRYSSVLYSHSCPSCVGNVKHSLEFVRQAFIKDGLQLLTDEYINAHTKMPYMCLVHPGDVFHTTWNSFESGNRCPKCGVRTGELNNKWLGGVTPIYNYLRNHLRKWKRASFIASGGRCAVTGELVGKKYVVHHLRSFNTIYQEVFSETGIDIRKELSDYTPTEIKRLKDATSNKHMQLLGVVLKRDIHELFHLHYGKGDNTIEQFEEFKIRFQRGDFGESLARHHA